MGWTVIIGTHNHFILDVTNTHFTEAGLLSYNKGRINYRGCVSVSIYILCNFMSNNSGKQPELHWFPLSLSNPTSTSFLCILHHHDHVIWLGYFHNLFQCLPWHFYQKRYSYPSRHCSSLLYAPWLLDWPEQFVRKYIIDSITGTPFTGSLIVCSSNNQHPHLPEDAVSVFSCPKWNLLSIILFICNFCTLESAHFSSTRIQQLLTELFPVLKTFGFYVSSFASCRIVSSFTIFLGYVSSLALSEFSDSTYPRNCFQHLFNISWT